MNKVSNTIRLVKNNVMVKVPGILKAVKAVGWYLDEHNIAQVSMNLVDYTITSLERAFEEVRKQARKRGVRVTGSEIVGLLPIDAFVSGAVYVENVTNNRLIVR